MEVKYNLHVVDLRVTIGINEFDGGWGTNITRTLTTQEVEEINDYVKTHKLGIRIAYDMWKFKNKKSLTLFMLRYG
jgi:hypothetical protein